MSKTSYQKEYRKNMTDEQKQRYIKAIKNNQKKYRKKYRETKKRYRENMTDEQKQKRRDYQREYYKKYYAAKKLNNKIIVNYDSDKIIDDSDTDNKIIDDSNNDNKIIDDSDNENDFYYISIIINFLNVF